MYPGYSLKVEEYRHPHEQPVKLIYLGIAVLGIAVMFVLNWAIAIGVLIGLGVIFLSWMLMLRSAVANHVRVTPTQFPEIYQLSAEAARRLNIPLPNMYVEQSPMLNAYATGFGNTFNIVLSTGLIQALTAKELQFVIAHEMGHVKSIHTVYSVVTNKLFTGNPLLFMFSWVQMVFRYALTFMSRVNEYTADRAGMVGCGSVYAGIAAMTKLAIGKEMFDQINIKEYFRQIEEFRSSKLHIFTELEASHPFIVNRIRAMAHFYKSAEYQTIKTKMGEGGTSILQEPIMGTMHLLDKIVDKYHPQPTQYTPPVAAPNYMPNPMMQPQGQQQIPVPQTPPVPQQAPMYAQAPVQPVMQPQAAASIGNTPATGMVACPNCAAQNRLESVFCFNCGTKMK